MRNLPSLEVSPLRGFIDEYFEAWRDGDPEKALGYFSEDAVIHLMGPVGILAGRKMVAEKWVIPTMTNYPSNIHQIKSFLEGDDQVAVEWLFTGVHVSTGKEITIAGCSIYWVSRGLIRRGNVYFNAPPPKRDQGLSASSPAHHIQQNQFGPQAPSNL